MRVFATKKGTSVKEDSPPLARYSTGGASLSTSRGLRSHTLSPDLSRTSELAGNCRDEENTYGESLIADFSNLGVGTIDNQTRHTFEGQASEGKSGELRTVLLPPGKWGGERPITHTPTSEKLDDIDFVFPAAGKPINCKESGQFKIGSNDARILPSPYDPKKVRSVIDDWNSYMP